MPPRGNEGLDFTPILTHYLFLFTTILAIFGWFIAFIGQAITTATLGNGYVGTLWFAIFLELFLILGVLHTLASDAIAMHRLQIATFGAVAIVFSVNGVNAGIFSGNASLDAMGAGWFILAVVNIIWTLYFTSEEDSLMFHIFNSLGTGGLTPPSRRRTRARASRSLSMGGANGSGAYTGNYATGGISSNDNFDSKLGAGGMGMDMGMGNGPVGSMGSAGPGVRSQNSFNGGQSYSGAGNTNDARSMTGTGTNTGGGGSVHNLPSPGGGVDGNVGQSSPLMAGNAGIGSGAGSTTLADSSAPQDISFTYKAKALYAYSASADDPNEISFSKGEILDIVDKQGKWWQAKKSDGTIGIVPSNYLQIV